MRGDVHVSHQVGDFPHGRFVQRLFLFLRRFPRAIVTPPMPASPAFPFEIFEDGVTRMACPSDVHPDRFELSPGDRYRLLPVVRGPLRVSRDIGPAVR